ncbi:protein kinase domain-containing protein [Nannocystaceae bacterium ST9]
MTDPSPVPDEALPTGPEDDVRSDPMATLFQTTFSDALDIDGEVMEARILGGLFDLPVRTPKIGRFEIRERLGSGGMGEVYAAWDPDLKRLVAVKLNRVGRAEPHELLREAQALAKVESPHVLPIYEVGVHGDRVFMAMKIVKGQTLAVWQGRDRALPDILSVYAQAARGLAHIHDSGMVHCDFKPANVLVGESNRVWVADFGLARFCSDSTGLAGTRAYMAPERLFDDHTTPASDQFSFCVSLFEAIYQASPFPGDAATFGRRLALCEVVLPPDAPRIPSWLAALLERGLRRDPSQRFPTMDALVDELTRDRRRAAKRAAWVLSTTAVASLVLLALRPNPPSPPSIEPLAGVWDDARSRQLRDHLDAIESPWIAACKPLILDPLAEWAERWQAEWMQTGAERMFGLGEGEGRHDCLLGQRAWIDRAVEDLLVAGSDRLWAAPKMLADLPAPELCREAPLGRPASIDEAEAERRQARLADAAALRSAFRFAESRAITDELIADGSNWPTLQIDALRERGRAWLEAGYPQPAVEDLRRASSLAIAQGEWGRVAVLSTDLIWAADATTPASVRGFLLDQAEAYAERLPPEFAERLTLIRALDAIDADNPELAERLIRTNLVKLGERRSIHVVENLHALALALDARGNDHASEAEAAYRVAIEQGEVILGSNHPQLAKLLSDAGRHALDHGQPELARTRLNRAYALRRASLPAGHPFLARSLLALADLEIRAGNFGLAEALVRAAISNGCEREREYEAFAMLGTLLAERGDWSGAIDWYRRSLRVLPNFDDQRAAIDVELAKALANLGDHDGATLLFDQSLSRVEAEFDLPQDGPQLLMTWTLRIGALDDHDRAIREFERIAVWIDDPHERERLFAATKRPRPAHQP